jgi:hypothetical protein
MEKEEQITFEAMEHKAVQAQEKAVATKKQVQTTFYAIANAALDALSARALVIYSLTLMAGAFAWSLADPSVLRLASATIFSGVLILTGVFKGGSDADQ